VDYDRASIGVKDGRLATAQRNTLHERLIASDPVFIDIHVRQIARVRTVGALEAMFLVQRIEMTSGARKGGSFTFSHCVNMNRMESLRNPCDVYSDQHPILSLTEPSAPNAFAFGVLDISACLALRGGICCVAPEG